SAIGSIERRVQLLCITPLSSILSNSSVTNDSLSPLRSKRLAGDGSTPGRRPEGAGSLPRSRQIKSILTVFFTCATPYFFAFPRSAAQTSVIREHMGCGHGSCERSAVTGTDLPAAPRYRQPQSAVGAAPRESSAAQDQRPVDRSLRLPRVSRARDGEALVARL